MTSTYVEVTLKDFTEFAAIFGDLPHVFTVQSGERVLRVELTPEKDAHREPLNMLLIWTSIPAGQVKAAEIGTDAIRVSLRVNGFWHSTKRVNRTEGWQERLAARVVDFIHRYDTEHQEVASTPVKTHHVEYCRYCGDPDINGEVEGIGPLCARHLDYVNDLPVMSYFAVVDEPVLHFTMEMPENNKPQRDTHYRNMDYLP